MYSRLEHWSHGTRARVRDNISCKEQAGTFRSKKSKKKVWRFRADRRRLRTLAKMAHDACADFICDSDSLLRESCCEAAPFGCAGSFCFTNTNGGAVRILGTSVRALLGRVERRIGSERSADFAGTFDEVDEAATIQGRLGISRS